MKIDFICQQEQSIYENDSCHIVCLLMLLKFIRFSPLPTYEELCEIFNLSDTNNLQPAPAITDLVRFLVRNNLNFRILFRKEDWEKALNMAPIMVAMYGGKRFWGEGGHMIILTQLTEGVFTYLDPWFSASSGRHIKTIDREEFSKYYGGFACQLLP